MLKRYRCYRILLLTITITANLYPQPNPLSLSMGSVRTDLKAVAVRIAVDYTDNLDMAWENLGINSNRMIYFTPDIKMETGEKDAFNRIIAKLTGSILWFPSDTVIAGIPTVDTRFFHSFPLSFGIESDRGFSRVNTIMEAAMFRGTMAGSAVCCSKPKWVSLYRAATNTP